MDRLPVTSSNLVSVGHDPDAEVLEIEFKGGAIYQYSGVSVGVYESFMNSDSKGKFFHANIREKYPTTKL